MFSILFFLRATGIEVGPNSKLNYHFSDGLRLFCYTLHIVINRAQTQTPRWCYY